MSIIFNATSQEIEKLGETALVLLVKKLIEAELPFDLKQRHVTSNTKSSDGGEDGFIESFENVEEKEFIKANKCFFQIKATKMGKKDCLKEIKENKHDRLKPVVRREVLDGAAYILICNKVNVARKWIEIRENEMQAYFEKRIPEIDGRKVAFFFDLTKIVNWTNKHFSCQLYLKHLSEKTTGLWLPSKEMFNGPSEFQETERNQQLITEIRKFIDSSGGVLPIWGLSGVGKTRLVYEAVGTEAAYLDLLNSEDPKWKSEIQASIVKATLDYRKGVFILDNCPWYFVDDFKRTLSLPHGTTLICIGNQDYPGRETVRISPEDNEQLIPSIISNIIQSISRHHLNQLVKLSGGYPFLAVELSKEWAIAGVSKLDLSKKFRIYERLLRSEYEGSPKILLEVLSLFDKVGYQDTAREEFENLIKNPRWFGGNEQPNRDYFDRIIKEFERKGIIEIIGRYISVKPIPLAAYLASEWLKDRSEHFLGDFLDSIRETSLWTRFCERLKFLGQSPLAESIAEKLCEGEKSPFINAESIQEYSGSRLFCALCFLSPKIASSRLVDLVEEKSNEYFLNFPRGARSQILYGIEQLLIHKESFKNSFKVLALFAYNETEKLYSNNSENTYSSLFQAFFPGTVASLKERGDFYHQLDDILGGNFLKMKLTALDAVFNSRQIIVRSVHYYGKSIESIDHKPSKEEVLDYFEWAIDELLKLLIGSPESRNSISKTFTKIIRAFLNLGLMEWGEKYVYRFIEEYDELWLEGKNDIEFLLAAKKDRDEPNLSLLQKISDRIVPNSLEEKIRLTICSPPSRIRQSEELPTPDFVKARELAVELISNGDWRDQIELFFRGKQEFTSQIGFQLAKSEDLQVPEDFNLILLNLKENGEEKNPNSELVRGLLEGKLSTERKIEFMKMAAEDANLERWIPKLVAYSRPNNEILNFFCKWLDNREFEKDFFLPFEYRPFIWDNLSDNEVEKFFYWLSGQGEEYRWTSLHLINTGIRSDGDLHNQLKTFGIKLFTIPRTVFLARDLSQHGTSWEKWASICLEDSKDHITFLSKEVGSYFFETSFSDFFDGGVIELFEKLVDVAPEMAWPIIGEDILCQENVGIRYVFSRRRDLFAPQSPIFNTISAVVLDWLRRNSSIQARRIASHMPLFDHNEESPQWHPFALAIIDDWGHDVEVLSRISNNIHSATYGAPFADHFERRIKLVKQLKDHQESSVREWVQEELKYLKSKLIRAQYEDLENEHR